MSTKQARQIDAAEGLAQLGADSAFDMSLLVSVAESQHHLSVGEVCRGFSH